MRIGAHVDRADPLAEAAARQADLVQFFLSDPQGWKAPEPHPMAEALRAATIDLYVHAPYLVNVATPNNRIRIPSRKIMMEHAQAASSIGAKALIVHGGHVDRAGDLAVGFANWRKAFEYAARDGGLPIRILIENTAGGDNAMARHLDRIAGVWDAISSAEGADDVGFCLDTCHAWAGGIELGDAVEKLRGITGRIDLVHANDSRDTFGSGADRHTNFGQGHLPADEFAGVVREAGAPVICETPGGAAEHQADFAWLREHL